LGRFASDMADFKLEVTDSGNNTSYMLTEQGQPVIRASLRG